MRLSVLAALLLALLAASRAEAQVVTKGDVTVGRPWTRATPAGAKVGAGYVEITNTGQAPDRLVGGTASFAASVEVHEMAMLDGVMRMRRLDKGIEIRPGETVRLEPRSYHLMFIGLKSPLKQGDKVKGTLVFEKAGSIEVEFEAAPIGAASLGG